MDFQWSGVDFQCSVVVNKCGMVVLEWLVEQFNASFDFGVVYLWTGVGHV